ncbi:hypothetical protein CEP51_008528 [Fusarium floridanum]|uniref:Uncharacterized protein n=1 Tax=Fusarium floridanum TaxID=1325733 RepID=A0A428RKN1_9HYPO|nr:hypothetical protein CEP51_008528 [Fusarium floridanum]
MTSTSLGGTKELATNTEPEKNISKSDNLPCAKASAQMLETPTSWRPSPPELPDVSEMDFLMGTVSATLKLMDTPATMFDKLSPDPSPSPVPRHDPVQYGPFMRALTTDPLLEISKEAAAELIQQWCDGVGMLYPIIDRQKMLDTAHGVLATLRYVQDNGVALHRGALMETLFNEETNKLKLILAISRTMECGPEDKTARRLFQSITEVVDSLVLNLTSIGRLQILLLAALYYYHIDEEVISGRIAHVQTAAQIAKNTIQTLADLNEKTPFVRNHPIFFKYPLLTALSNLLTAAARSGPETSKAEIGIALSLFELLSMSSRQVMRIWQRLEGIQALQALLYSSTPDERSVGAITPPEHSPPEPFPLEVLLDLYPLV